MLLIEHGDGMGSLSSPKGYPCAQFYDDCTQEIKSINLSEHTFSPC
jgi:hypothetical protein